MTNTHYVDFLVSAILGHAKESEYNEHAIVNLCQKAINYLKSRGDSRSAVDTDDFFDVTGMALPDYITISDTRHMSLKEAGFNRKMALDIVELGLPSLSSDEDLDSLDDVEDIETEFSYMDIQAIADILNTHGISKADLRIDLDIPSMLDSFSESSDTEFAFESAQDFVDLVETYPGIPFVLSAFSVVSNMLRLTYDAKLSRLLLKAFERVLNTTLGKLERYAQYLELKSEFDQE